mmetsp:Transcript_109499/g.316554  ORF Transcript_109499/g.316554 Transcript_109499/m.316554 type:complete len:577 (-) Transcript_109499:83-1813(-)
MGLSWSSAQPAEQALPDGGGRAPAQSPEEPVAASGPPREEERVEDLPWDGLEALRREVAALRDSPPWFVREVGELRVPPLLCSSEGDLRKPPWPNSLGPWDLVLLVSGSPDPTPPEVDAAPEVEVVASQADVAACGGSVSIFRALPSVGTWLLPRFRSCPVGQGAKPREVARKASSLENPRAYDAFFRVRIRFDNEWPRSPPDTVRFQCVIHHALLDDDGSLPMPFYRTLPKDESGQHSLLGVVSALRGFLLNPLKAWGIEEDDAPEKFRQQLKALQQTNEQRLRTIQRYSQQVKHPELFASPLRLREEWFAPSLWRAAQVGTPEAWRSILHEHLPGEIFSFEMFTSDFCNRFVEEIFNFYASGLPAKRPNSMNNYGIILNEIGLEPFIDELQRMLQPLGECLWPNPGSAWDGHHCFIVRYRENEDLGLDMHTDDSDVTFNVCLGLDFEGAGIQFCGVMGAADHRKHSYTYKHVRGTCVCHLGRKRHGADDIVSGERLNMILWNHSSTYRQSTEYNEPDYDKENGPPDQVCVSYTHDRDFGVFRDYPKRKEHFLGKGWCPPKDFEYDGFKPDTEKR